MRESTFILQQAILARPVPVPCHRPDSGTTTLSGRWPRRFSAPEAIAGPWSLISSAVYLLPAFFFLILLFPDPAYAHTFQEGGGFWSGLTHPVLGFDHFLAMLCVGIISAQIGGRAIWTVPMTFVLVMAAGGILGMGEVSIPAVEYGIAFSVAILGVALALGKKITPMLAMTGVAIFAVFHGHAHGTEMPEVAEPFPYAAGFLLGTAAIHLAGVVFGSVASKVKDGPEFIRFVGAGIAGAGIYIIHILLKF
jgi:urease accessory protein